ncbi:hypothetical protein ACFQ9X_20230 [Catenulispora yoronensis]
MSAYTSAVRHGGHRLPLLGLAALGSSAIALSVPDVLGAAIDAAAGGRAVAPRLLAAAALMGIGVLCDMTAAYITAATTARTTAWLRLRMTRRVLDAGPSAAGAFTPGDLLGRVCANSADASRAGPGLVTALAAVVPRSAAWCCWRSSTPGSPWPSWPGPPAWPSSCAPSPATPPACCAPTWPRRAASSDG